MGSQHDEEIKLKASFLYHVSSARLNIPDKLKCYLSYNFRRANDFLSQPIWKSFPKQKTCPFCYTTRTADNSDYILKPRVRPGPAMRKIMRKHAKHKRLSKVEEKLLKRAARWNVMVIKCLMCHKKITVPLKNDSAMKLKVNQAADHYRVAKKEIKLTKKKKMKSPILNTPSCTIDLASETINLVNETINLDTDTINVTSDNDQSNQVIDMDVIECSPPKKISCPDFVPLNYSTPCTVNKKKRRKKEFVRNPLGLKSFFNPNEAPDYQKKRKRMSSLLKVVNQEEASKKHMPYKSPLKAFLNRI